MELRCVKTVAAPSGWHGFSNTGSLPWTDHPSRKMRFVASVCVNASLCFCKVVCSPRRNASGILRCWPLKTMREGDGGALRGRAVLGPRRAGGPQQQVPPLVAAITHSTPRQQHQLQEEFERCTLAITARLRSSRLPVLPASGHRDEPHWHLRLSALRRQRFLREM